MKFFVTELSSARSWGHVCLTHHDPHIDFIPQSIAVCLVIKLGDGIERELTFFNGCGEGVSKLKWMLKPMNVIPAKGGSKLSYPFDACPKI